MPKIVKASVKTVYKGYPGHRGRPGLVGGSLPRDAGPNAAEVSESLRRDRRFIERSIAYLVDDESEFRRYVDRYVRTGMVSSTSVDKLMSDYRSRHVSVESDPGYSIETVKLNADTVKDLAKQNKLAEKICNDAKLREHSSDSVNNAWDRLDEDTQDDIVTRIRDSAGNQNLSYNDVKTFISSAWEFKHGDFHSAVTDIKSETSTYNPTEHVLSVSGIIVDDKGVRVGSFDRSILPDGVVVHGFLELNENAQGTGFGTAFYKRSEEVYMKLGFRDIYLHANLDVGGYTWARLGFDFSNRQTLLNNVSTAESLWNKRYNESMPSHISSAINHAWELAALTGPDGFAIGKNALLGSSWDGTKSIAEGSAGLEAGQLYYAYKGM